MVPALFICHGSPALAIENNEYTKFISELGKKIKPKGIIIFTAHWENDIPKITSRNGYYDMIYDFGGFPEELYSIRYTAMGSESLAEKLQMKFEEHGIKSEMDPDRGLDHGSWVVLRLLYPDGNIPIVQVSVNPKLSMRDQYMIGKSIREFGEEDILIIGSGGTVHNLETVKWDTDKPESWAVSFDDWLIEKILSKDTVSLFDCQNLAPFAKKAIPREEHIAPLFITMGSESYENLPKLLYRGYKYGTLSHICIQF